MPTVDWARVITISVAPVVIISACSLLCLAFYNRMAAIVSRLRGFQRERLHEQGLMSHDNAAKNLDHARHKALLDHLETQTWHVTRRAKLIRLTLLLLLLAIALLIGCCMTLGLSVLFPSVVFVSVFMFVLGLLSMLFGIIAAMLELRDALEPAEIESRFVTRILHRQDSQANDAD
jgi:Protein of unknown function (DUF2721)